MRKILDKIPMMTLVIFSLTLGLAPFVPEPHVWQKLNMLISGNLTKLIDIGDLVFHGLPWVLLGLKIALAKPQD